MTHRVKLFRGGTFRDRQGYLWTVIDTDRLPWGERETTYLAVQLQVVGGTSQRQWFFANGRWSLTGHCSIDLIERASRAATKAPTGSLP